MNKAAVSLAWSVIGILPLAGQTTQGLISGSAVDAITGRPIAGASVTYAGETLATTGTLKSDAAGYYFLPLLSAGSYRIRITADAYQSQQLDQIELPVAGRVQIDFKLRPLSDIFEAGQFRSVFLPGSKTIVTFYGPDVDTSRSATFDGQQALEGALETSVSYVIDPAQLGDLPLSGRNVYQLLSFQPGVTSGVSGGTALSVNGQNSSLFLLDGVGSPAVAGSGINRPVLLGGGFHNAIPVTIGPEFVQEYRVSTGDFSPEFGRTTGFVANAITRAGSKDFHGLGYYYLNNEALNANAFQSNTNGFPRQRFRELQAGATAGGPLGDNKTFFFAGYEEFRSRTLNYPFVFEVPIVENFRKCPQTASSQALLLLQRFAPPLAPARPGPPCDNLSGPYSFAVPVAVDRGLAVARFDRLLNNGQNRIMLRAISNRETDPDSIFSLYKDFTTAQKVHTTAIALDGVAVVSPNIVMEIRAGWQHATNDLPLNNPQVPALSTAVDGNRLFSNGISLPGVVSSVSAQRFREDHWEIESNTTVNRLRHFMTFGGGAYFDNVISRNAFLQSGQYQFASLQNFGQDLADVLQLTVSRGALATNGALAAPDYSGGSRRIDLFGFFQDSFRVTRRLTLNYGVRFDYFGVPRNSGGQDAFIQTGTQAGIETSIRTAGFVFGQACCTSPYSAYRKDFGPRVALSYDLTGSGKYLFRSAYGLLYDRPPDISTAGNSLEVVTLFPPTGYLNVNYSMPLLGQAASAARAPVPGDPQPILISPALEAPRVQSWFAGFKAQLPVNIAMEVNYTGSSSSNLVVTDDVNRTNTTNLNSSRLNPSLPFDLSYAGNVGYSRFNAATALVRYRSRWLFLQTSYTLGHSIDNNSGYFTRQFDRQLDRGSSDFDQRQNAVIYAVLQPPPLRVRQMVRTMTGGWTFGALAGFRSGFPYSVYAGEVPGIQPCAGGAAAGNNPVLLQNRPSLIPGIAPELAHPIPVAGGVQLLNPAAFCRPAADAPGNFGRNALTGPGFWNVDLSAGKTFGLKWLGEAGRVQVRADFYNSFNHANLGDPIVSNTGFGVFSQAFYGKSAAPPDGVSVVPLDEAPRRIQLQIRVYF